MVIVDGVDDCIVDGGLGADKDQSLNHILDSTPISCPGT